jgi:aryl-alcohol dehydrogenase-like predicted oxidoreductase
MARSSGSTVASGCNPDKFSKVRYRGFSGARLSVIGLGTWQFGSREWAYGAEFAHTVAPQLVRRALDVGINLIDTAAIYGRGRSEHIVGEALGARRSEAYLATKLFPLFPVEPVVVRAAHRSAERLGTDRLDLYQVHWPNPAFPFTTTMRGMARLVEAGLISAVGVSNFSGEQWRRAERALGRPILSNQVHYSLLDRRVEADVLPWAQANDRVVIGYSPLEMGLLSGNYGLDRLPKGFRRRTLAFTPENFDRVAPVLDVVREVARSHDATASQVALAWCLRRPNVVVIPGASSIAQLDANAEAAELALSAEDDAALTEASDALVALDTRAAVANQAKRVGGRLSRRIGDIKDALSA